MMTKKIIFSLMTTVMLTTAARGQKNDTIIVGLAKTSKVIFTIRDKTDLDILKHYDFQKLFQDIIAKLEKSDSSSSVQKDSTQIVVTKDIESQDDTYWHKHRDHGSDNEDDDDNDDDFDKNSDWGKWKSDHFRWRRTWQSFNFDLGANNYVQNGKFPDGNNAQYSVKPWGSWYFAGNSVHRSRLGKNFFLEWGFGLSWYNFKFQNANTIMQKSNDKIEFLPDPRGFDYIKSKLTATYINASLIPVIDFSDHGKKHRVWDGHGDSFRIGLGPYVGYRVASHSKLVYKDNGPREKEKNRDNLYLNTLRYGARLQVGFRSTDLFFNYDMNELFSSGRGPGLNAFSFGIIF